MCSTQRICLGNCWGIFQGSSDNYQEIVGVQWTALEPRNIIFLRNVRGCFKHQQFRLWWPSMAAGCRAGFRLVGALGQSNWWGPHQKMKLCLLYLSKTGVRRYYHRHFFWILHCQRRLRALAYFRRTKTNFPILFLQYLKTITSWFFFEFCIVVGEFEYIFFRTKTNFPLSHPLLNEGPGVLRTPGKMLEFLIVVGVSVSYKRTKTNFPLPSLPSKKTGVQGYITPGIFLEFCIAEGGKFRTFSENENSSSPLKPVVYTGWPRTWKTWKTWNSQGIWKASGNSGKTQGISMLLREFCENEKFTYFLPHF